MNEYVLGLGANLGSRKASLAAALRLLSARRDCELGSVSSLYESAPLGPPQPRYLNAAARVRTTLAPREMLAALLEIESALGRSRGVRWGARAIDLDLLWSQVPYADAELVVPHPELSRRWWALLPLLEVAPELRPQYAASLRELETASDESKAPAAAPGWDTARGASHTRRLDRDVLELEVVAEDRPEALAAVVSALGAERSAPAACRASEAVVLLNAADAAAAVTLALAHSRFACATVSACAGERVTVHLVGADGASELLHAELLGVFERSTATGHAIRISVRLPAVQDM